MAENLPTRIARLIVEDHLSASEAVEGARLPSVRALQKQYEVSNSSIAHALSILQAEGYLVKAHGKGSFVADRRERSQLQTIAFIIPDVTTNSSILMAIYNGVEHRAKLEGYHVLVVSTNNDYRSEKKQAEHLARSGCRGIILYPAPRTPRERQNDYLNHELNDFPITLVDMAEPHQRRSQITFDNQQAGCEMTRLMLQKGHEHIGFMRFANSAGEYTHRVNNERFEGYLSALKMAGRSPREQDIWTLPMLDKDNQRYWLLHEAVVQWRSRPDRLTAMISIDDYLAQGLIMIAQSLQVALPDELAICGFDNVQHLQYQNLISATTAPDFQNAGEMALRLLVTQIREQSDSKRVYVLPAPILERARLVHANDTRDTLMPIG